MIRGLFFFCVAALAGCVSSTPGSGGGGDSDSEGTTYEKPEVSTRKGGADPATGEIRYLALGDSLTYGGGVEDPEKGAFPVLLAEKWRAKGCKVELKNVGIGGYTSAQVISDELPSIAELKPTFITFQVGGNDIVQHVTLTEYRTNVTKIIADATASGARVVVLAQNEWYRSPEGVSYGDKTFGSSRTSFDDALFKATEAASSKGAELVDLRYLYKQEADGKQWASDGLHPIPAAYETWAAELARVIPAPCKQ